MPDKSADDFDEEVDQEVDGLFFDELSPYEASNLASNNVTSNMNQDIEEIEPGIEALGIDAQNLQTLMNNPGLTSHLISVLSNNLQKREQKKQNQATPVFSYGEIMQSQNGGEGMMSLLKQINETPAQQH